MHEVVIKEGWLHVSQLLIKNSIFSFLIVIYRERIVSRTVGYEIDNTFYGRHMIAEPLRWSGIRKLNEKKSM